MRLFLLGPARVEAAGTVVRGFESRKALALLCYLAATRLPAPRSRLADLFWGDKAERRGRGNLSRVLHNLSHLLPGITNGDPDAVELEWPLLWTDLSEFSALESRGDIASLTCAARLHRSEFLAGLDLDDCPGFGAWLDGERERWRRRVSQTLLRLAEYHARRRENDQALKYASGLLVLEPWCEEAHRQMMRALARGGRRTAALAEYDACRRMLATELGVAPCAETNELYHRIKATGDHSPTNLPVEATPFVGRERDLAEIAGLLADPDCRLLTLLGAGGIGKTRLALRAARAEAAGRGFLDGIRYVPLGDVAATDALVSGLAGAVGLSLIHARDPKQRLLGFLAGREMLLLLDAFEHLVPTGLELVLELLRRAPGLKLLVTSRQRLRVEGEWLYEVRGLAVPDDAAEPSSEESSAVRLFLESARRIRPGLAVSADDRRSAGRVCRRLEGLPLGIELAAAWSSDCSLAEIARRVERDAGALAVDLLGIPARHASLRTVLEDSWSLLSAPERDVLRRLSVFRGGFVEEAARVVAGATPTNLDALVGKSFLRRAPDGRYMIHDLLREHAEARLAECPDERQLAQDRHSAYYCTFLERFAPRLPGREQKCVLGEIGAELANVRTAWAWAVERLMTADLRRAVPAFFWFHELRGWYQDGAVALKAAIDALRRCRSEEVANRETGAILGMVLSRYAWLLHRNEDFEKALAASAESERLLRVADPDGEMGFLLTTRGIMVWLMGDQPAACRFLQAALELARSAGHAWRQTWALGMLGMVQAPVDASAAEQALAESLRLNETCGDPLLQSLALNGLARVASARGEFRDARRLFQQAVEMCFDCDHVFGAALGLSDLGCVACELDELSTAEERFEESLAMFTEMDERWGIARATAGLARVAQRRGDPSLARRYYRESLAAAMSVQAVPTILECFAGVAGILAADGGPVRARQLADLVLRHPAAESIARQEARRVQALLRMKPAVAREAWRAPGLEPSLEETAQALLAELRPEAMLELLS